MIQIYTDDHRPPHFYARYSEEGAVSRVRDLALPGGRRPGRALGLVNEEAALHQRKFLNACALDQRGVSPGEVAPLD